MVKGLWFGFSFKNTAKPSSVHLEIISKNLSVHALKLRSYIFQINWDVPPNKTQFDTYYNYWMIYIGCDWIIVLDRNKWDPVFTSVIQWMLTACFLMKLLSFLGKRNYEHVWFYEQGRLVHLHGTLEEYEKGFILSSLSIGAKPQYTWSSLTTSSLLSASRSLVGPIFLTTLSSISNLENRTFFIKTNILLASTPPK